jgi:hypothetical protein
MTKDKEYQMNCRKCSGRLEILRMCSRVFMQCSACKHKYQIHEVADQLNKETEEILGQYTSIIYD